MNDEGNFLYQIPHFMSEECESLNAVALTTKHILAAYAGGRLRGFARMNGALQFCVAVASGAGASLTHLAVASPQLLLAGDASGAVHVLDAAYGKPLRQLRAADSEAPAAASGGKKKKKKKGGAASTATAAAAAPSGGAWPWGFCAAREPRSSALLVVSSAAGGSDTKLSVWRGSIL